MSQHAFDVKDPKFATVFDSGVVVAEMAGRLFEFRCGPHDRRSVEGGIVGAGFWAIFIDTRGCGDLTACEECDEPLLDFANTSHGATLPEAICLAARAAYDNDRSNIED